MVSGESVGVNSVGVMTRVLTLFPLLCCFPLVLSRPFFPGQQSHIQPIHFHDHSEHQTPYYKPVQQFPFSDIYRGVKNHIVNNVGLIARDAKNKAQSLFSQWHNTLLPSTHHKQLSHGTATYGFAPSHATFGHTAPQQHHVRPFPYGKPIHGIYPASTYPLVPTHQWHDYHYAKVLPPGVAPQGNSQHPRPTIQSQVPIGQTVGFPAIATSNQGNTYQTPVVPPKGNNDDVGIASEPDTPLGASGAPNAEEDSESNDEQENYSHSPEIPAQDSDIATESDTQGNGFPIQGITHLDHNEPVDAVSEPDYNPQDNAEESEPDDIPEDNAEESEPDDIPEDNAEESEPDEIPEGSTGGFDQEEEIPEQGPSREIGNSNNNNEQHSDYGDPVGSDQEGSISEVAEVPSSGDEDVIAFGTSDLDEGTGQYADEDGDEAGGSGGVDYDQVILKGNPIKSESAVDVRRKE